MRSSNGLLQKTPFPAFRQERRFILFAGSRRILKTLLCRVRVSPAMFQIARLMAGDQLNNTRPQPWRHVWRNRPESQRTITCWRVCRAALQNSLILRRIRTWVGVQSTSFRPNGGSATMSYQPIENYGIIGNMRTVAHVGINGSIDWYCYPHFDSPSIFGALLDDKNGGSFPRTIELRCLRLTKLP
jgi:hypothetical protein